MLLKAFRFLSEHTQKPPAKIKTKNDDEMPGFS